MSYFPNHVWSVDFVHNKFSNGWPYEMPTVLDEYSREVLAVTVTSEMRRLRQLEDENAKLKRIVADLSLDKAMLQDVLSKKL
jgi:transposase InsO family protein